MKTLTSPTRDGAIEVTDLKRNPHDPQRHAERAGDLLAAVQRRGPGDEAWQQAVVEAQACALTSIALQLCNGVIATGQP